MPKSKTPPSSAGFSGRPGAVTRHNPAAMAAPVGAYSHGIEVPAGARSLHVAGQVGIAPDGTIADDFAAQAEQAWRNLEHVLAAAGMGVDDLVKVTSFLLHEEDVPAYRTIMLRHLGEARPATTLLIVKALARPQFRVEVEATAAEI
jgi:2-iminobutanoate/2-iminopropanoate deaminase